MKKVIAITIVTFILLMAFNSPSTSAQSGKIRVLWFDAHYRDPGFSGYASGVPPNMTIFSRYPNMEIVEVSSASALPPDWNEYDVLVLADCGFPENLSEFKGGLIVTIDSSVSTFFYWLTGNNQAYNLWSYYRYTIVKWIKPYSGYEQVNSTRFPTYNDAALYKVAVDSVSWLAPRYDLVNAVANDSPDRVAAALYQVNLKGSHFYWLFLGPYDIFNPQTSSRQSYLVGDLITRYSNLIWPPKTKTPSIQFSTLTFMYYRHYLILNETLTNAIESTTNPGLRENLTEKLELAHEEYKTALRYGPILRNLSNIHVFIHLRKAVIYLREALSFLS